MLPILITGIKTPFNKIEKEMPGLRPALFSPLNANPIGWFQNFDLLETFGPEHIFDGFGRGRLGVDCHRGRCKQEDSVADALLMPVDGMSGAGEEIYDTLRLIVVQQVQVEQDRFARAQLFDNLQ